MTTVLKRRDVEVDAGEQFTGHLIASDVDGDDISFQLMGGPTGFIVNGDGSMEWSPIIAGTFTVRVAVTDGDLTDQMAFTIIVNEADIVDDDDEVDDEIDDDGTDEESKDKESNTPTLIAVVIIVVVALISLIFLIFRGREKEQTLEE